MEDETGNANWSVTFETWTLLEIAVIKFGSLLGVCNWQFVVAINVEGANKVCCDPIETPGQV